MHLNIDELVDPWDFKVTVGGKDFPTRPATVQDLSALEEIEKAEQSGKATEVIGPAKALVESLFVGEDRPAFPGAAHEWVPLVLMSLMEYIVTRAKKNALARDHLKAGMSAPRDSSPDSAGSIPPSTP